MSHTLYFRRDVPGSSVSEAVKDALFEEYGWGLDYQRLDKNSKGYIILLGLRAKGVKGTHTLINAIDKHGTIVLELR